jgi:hypothetical protein
VKNFITSNEKNAALLKTAALLMVACALPAAIYGQTKVNVVNTPNVKVTNTPTVNVNSLPAVQLAPGAAVAVSGTPTVEIGNAAGNPVPVHDPATPGRTPFQTTINITVDDGVSGGNGLVSVPAGKRLVIEYASAFGGTLSGDTLTFSIFTQDSANTNFIHYLPATQVVDLGARHSFIAGQTVKLYSNPGSLVDLRLDRTTPAGPVSAFFSISGFLEDVQ